MDVRPVEKPEPAVIALATTEESKAMMNVKEALARLKKGVHGVLKQQQRDRHRLALHSQTNKLSHEHVVRDSIIETATFVFTALFQVFFVRRWFVNKQYPAAGKQRP